MESDCDKDVRLDDKMKQGEFSVCKQRLINLGLPAEHAEIACSVLLIKKDEDDVETDDFLLLFTDEEDGKPSKECIVRKIKIFAHEHPEWEHDKVVAAAHGYCRKHQQDAGEPVSIVGIVGGRLLQGRISPVTSVPLRQLTNIINIIKNTKGLKVGHAGIMPFLASLPMKNLNRLQTKLEKLTTAEQKNLTAEELTRRKAYARQMKKDSVWMNDQIVIEKANTGLNNIIKAPIILAREMTQEYVFRKNDGSIVKEMHFKPYNELKMAIQDLEELPMLIEHHDSWEDDQIIGYVKDFVADDELRAVRGTGYFLESKCPTVLLDMLRSFEMVGVSIGFMASLGESGVFEGIMYDHAQKEIILEHLAICLESVPRCPLGKCGVNILDGKEYVYFIQGAEDSIKIGRSNDPDRRLMELQTASPIELKFIKVIEGDEKLESEIHTRFGKSNIRGEWFKPSKRLLEFIDNLESPKYPEFTIITKDNYYYNINELIFDAQEETSIGINSESEIKSDNMEDSFADPKSGKISGDEPKDLETMLERLRKYMHGESDLLKRNFAIQKVKEILRMTDEGEEEDSAQKGEDMDQKEFEDAIAAKDRKISELSAILKEMLISEIKQFADAKQVEKLKLDEKCVPELKIIRDTILTYDLPKSEPETIPEVSPEEHKQEVAEKVKGSQYKDKIQELNAEVQKEFDLTGIEFVE